MAVKVRDPARLGGELRLVAALPSLGLLPPHAAFMQDPPYGLDPDRGHPAGGERWSRSSASDQQENGRPRNRGSHRAITQVQSRTCSLILFGLPRPISGPARRTPRSLNVRIIPPVVAGALSKGATSAARWPAPTSAPRSPGVISTGSFLAPVMRCSRWPSGIDSARPRISGRRSTSITSHKQRRLERAEPTDCTADVQGEAIARGQPCGESVCPFVSSGLIGVDRHRGAEFLSYACSRMGSCRRRCGSSPTSRLSAPRGV